MTHNDDAQFLLFIAKGSKSQQALRNIRQLLDSDKVQIVDITKDAKAALKHGIMATPTLLKSNNPEQMIIGTLDDFAHVSATLGIPPKGGG